MRITDTDKGLKNLLKRSRLLKGSKLTVGIHAAEGDQEHKGTTATVAQVASWLEFGTTTQPARPFIRGWFDENEAIAKEAVRRMAEQVVAGKITPDQALEKLGLFFVGEIQLKIAAGLVPPNAPSTIARKGSDKAGIDTGQVRSSVTFKVGK